MHAHHEESKRKDADGDNDGKGKEEGWPLRRRVGRHPDDWLSVFGSEETNDVIKWDDDVQSFEHEVACFAADKHRGYVDGCVCSCVRQSETENRGGRREEGDAEKGKE